MQVLDADPIVGVFGLEESFLAVHVHCGVHGSPQNSDIVGGNDEHLTTPKSLVLASAAGSICVFRTIDGAVKYCPISHGAPARLLFNVDRALIKHGDRDVGSCPELIHRLL